MLLTQNVMAQFVNPNTSNSTRSEVDELYAIDDTVVKKKGFLNLLRNNKKDKVSREKKSKISKELKIHSPHKATLLALIPGLGQIYNKQYWKLPILYGGMAATYYGITWNNSKYKDYRASYFDMYRYVEALSEDPDTPYPDNPAWESIPLAGKTSWKELLTQNPDLNERFMTIFNNKRTSFKRNRDLCYIVMAGIYALNIIDACVFAHFYNFEINDDLSLNLRPASTYSSATGATVGASVALTF